jgi:hypothetical protein
MRLNARAYTHNPVKCNILNYDVNLVYETTHVTRIAHMLEKSQPRACSFF